MKNRHLRILACSIGAAVLLGRAAFAADWPRWRGPDNNGVVPPGVAVPSRLPNEPKILWKAPLAEGLGSAVVSQGKVFAIDNCGEMETLVALDFASGKELWHATVDQVIGDNQGSGPRDTPVVDGPRVYVQSCRGELQCLAVADGKLIWRINYVKDLGAEFIGEKGQASGATRHGFTGPPLVDGDRLIVFAGGLKGASVAALDKQSGAVVWKSQNDTAGYAGPVIATLAGKRQILAYTAVGLLGIDAANGGLLWRRPIKTSFGRHVTMPVAADDVAVVSSHEAGLLGYRISADGGAVKVIDAWCRKDLAINFCSPVVVGHYLYGLGPKKKLFCADVRDGKETWVKTNLLPSPAAYASLLVMGENLLVLGDSGQAFLIAADPKECRVLGSAKLCGKNWCCPAYADGKLIVRDKDGLRCLELK